MFLRRDRKVYLDANSTSQASKAVRRTVDRTAAEAFGNPSSPHGEGRLAASLLEGARREVAKALNAGDATVVFVSGATEAAHLAVQSCLREAAGELRRRVLTTPIEHACVHGALEAAAPLGRMVQTIPVDATGKVDLEALRGMLGEDVSLVCCMLANNEVGTVQDIANLTRIVHECGAKVLCDCVQAVGRIPVDLSTLGVDYAFLSAHKFHGPRGAGALVVRNGAPVSALLSGGHQEQGLRAGTENLPALAGMAEALRGVPAMLARREETARLARRLQEGIRRLVPQARFFHPEDGLPNTLSVRFPGTANAVLLGWLDSRGVAVGAGSACNTESDEPSHVLLALGATPEEARETLRFSLVCGGDAPTVPADIDRVLELLGEYFGGKVAPLGMVMPSQVDEAFLARPDLWILDARHGYDRRFIASFPGAHEIDWPFARSLPQVPRDRRVLVVCQAGVDAPILAWKLRRQGVRDVSFLALGMAGWKVAHRKG